jgi:5'-nucleotidase
VSVYEAAVKPLQDRIISETAAAITRKANDAGESALGNLVADSQRSVLGTQIAFMNPGGIRSDLDAGKVTWGELYSIQPFGNNMVRMTMNGDQIRRVLNQQWQKSGDQIITRFLQISGLKYTWDDTRSFGDKVVSIWLENGQTIDPKSVYTVALNVFIATGGDSFTAFTESKDQVIGMVDLDAFVQYVSEQCAPFNASITGRIVKLR